MATVPQSNKVKIAKRVLEVLEYFDENHRSATVMDVARRYGRPQSSTSELLSSLVEMGFLYKDARSRSYMPTPRVAVLGAAAQPKLLRGGGLLPQMERLARNTGCAVALLGMVGTHVQIYRWVATSPWHGKVLETGASEPLSDSIGGMLLLSAQEPEASRGLLRRLNAEASDERKFNHPKAVDQVQRLSRQGWALGECGFDPGTEMIGLLLPREGDDRPLVLALMYECGREINVNALLSEMRAVIAACADTSSATESSEPLLRVVGS
jgi:DNA-binding IclR family transcriptional regulator